LSESEILRRFKQLVRQVALTTVSQRYTITGRRVRKTIGITPYQLGRVVRRAVEEGRVPGVKVVAKGRRLQFVIDKKYWVRE